MPHIGKHIILDLSGAQHLEEEDYIKHALEEAAKVCGATVIGTKLHKFGGKGGITGVVMLAESHITIHTWPERSYIALDIFMCGACDPENAIDHLEKAFKPKDLNVTVIKRGRSGE
ncbi:MAG: adenosylmethionine decarboxylase [Rickettsiales bacterium]|nr:adenosylmethionine decarboxylase [Rickettsiales bacterium]